MEEKKRLLCIVGGMNVGGAETFLMKIYRALDKSYYQMDFAVAVQNGYYDNEILSMGGRIFHITPKSKGIIKNLNDIRKLVKKEHYRYVLRVSQHSLSALELFAAMQGGAKVRVFRSSNSNTTTASKMDLLLHKLCGFMPKIFANVRLAPSTEAARFMFGKRCIEKGKAHILHNGIDLEKYTYTPSYRENIRKEFLIKDNFVVGHIGRFNHQKNHSFLIDIFLEIKKKNKNAILVLVGQGELEAEIRQKIQNLNLSDSVIFTGIRSDIPQLLSAMDVFVFPSFYEGMPNTVIEAQATGLPCLISDTITKEADITGLVKYMSLSSSPSQWAEAAVNMVADTRKNTYNDFIENHYTINTVAQDFVNLIFNQQSLRREKK